MRNNFYEPSVKGGLFFIKIKCCLISAVVILVTKALNVMTDFLTYKVTELGLMSFAHCLKYKFNLTLLKLNSTVL